MDLVGVVHVGEVVAVLLFRHVIILERGREGFPVNGGLGHAHLLIHLAQSLGENRQAPV